MRDDHDRRPRTLRDDLSRARTTFVSQGLVAALAERTRSFTTGHRLAVVAVATFVPLALVAAVLAVGLGDVSTGSATTAEALDRRVVDTTALATELDDAEARLVRYLASGTAVDLAAFRAAAAGVDEALDTLRAEAPDGLGRELDRAAATWGVIRDGVPDAPDAAPLDAAARAELGVSVGDAFRSVDARLLAVARDAGVTAAGVTADQAGRARSLRLLVLLGVPLSFLLGLSLVSWLVRDLRRGTDRLRAAAAELEEGRLDVRVDVTHGDLAPVAAAFNEMAERIERQQRELTGAANRDELTGVLNRRGFDDELRTELERAARYGGHTALLLLDLDHFKQVNDTFGHPVGDVVLKAIAKEIGDAVRAVDRVGRWGGEEFAVLLPETETAAARHVARRINQVVGQRVVIAEGHKIRVTTSVGVTVHDPAAGPVSADELVERADRALYEAKEAGRDRVVFAS